MTVETYRPEANEHQPPTVSRPRFADRTALITAAASGIGRATAELLAAEGASLVLFDIGGDRLKQVADELASRGARIVAAIGSATEPLDCNATAAHCIEAFGKIDVLVNGVGGSIIPTMPLWEVSDDQWNLMMNLNLTSTFNFCRAVVPYMLETQWGRIVNVASTAGKEGNPLTAAYCSAKAGVIGLTKSLGKELATTGILVNAISPAVIETQGTTSGEETSERRAHLDRLRAKIPMSRMGTAAEVAYLIAFLASEQMSFSTGAVFDISGGRATY